MVPLAKRRVRSKSPPASGYSSATELVTDHEDKEDKADVVDGIAGASGRKRGGLAGTLRDIAGSVGAGTTRKEDEAAAEAAEPSTARLEKIAKLMEKLAKLQCDPLNRDTSQKQKRHEFATTLADRAKSVAEALGKSSKVRKTDGSGEDAIRKLARRLKTSSAGSDSDSSGEEPGSRGVGQSNRVDIMHT